MGWRRLNGSMRTITLGRTWKRTSLATCGLRWVLRLLPAPPSAYSARTHGLALWLAVYGSSAHRSRIATRIHREAIAAKRMLRGRRTPCLHHPTPSDEQRGSAPTHCLRFRSLHRPLMPWRALGTSPAAGPERGAAGAAAAAAQRGAQCAHSARHDPLRSGTLTCTLRTGCACSRRLRL